MKESKGNVRAEGMCENVMDVINVKELRNGDLA
jgi:hypothetical protein